LSAAAAAVVLCQHGTNLELDIFPNNDGDIDDDDLDNQAAGGKNSIIEHNSNFRMRMLYALVFICFQKYYRMFC
jgi:hypothetical protein